MVPFTEGSLELAPGVPGALSCPVLVVPVASLPDRALAASGACADCACAIDAKAISIRTILARVIELVMPLSLRWVRLSIGSHVRSRSGIL
jgi:hypothetical protein